MRDLLKGEGHFIGRKHVATLVRTMGILALYQKPNTSRRHAAHPVYPYLLRNVPIERPNHVWAMDITYVPMARGFVYLAAVMDWASRRVLAWRVSISMDGKGCWRDNVFVERLWKSIKCEEIYLHAYNTASDARAGIAKYFMFHNQRRPHSEHGGKSAEAMYFDNLELKQAA